MERSYTTSDYMALTDNVVQLRKNGTNVGSSLANGVTITPTETTQTYGGPTNKWGTAWSQSDMATLGFRWSGRSTVTGSTVADLIASTPSMSIPAGATIDGIEVRVKLKTAGSGTASATFSVNLVDVNVYYTSSGIKSRQSMNGGVTDRCTGGVAQ